MPRLPFLTLALFALATLPACDSAGGGASADAITTPTRDEVEASSFTGALSCEVILSTGTNSGTISDADSACRYDLDNGGTVADLVFFKVASSTSVRISMTSSDFTPEIILNSESAELGRATSAGTATLTASVRPGLYQIIAGGRDAGRGAYTITVAAQ